MRTYPDFTWEWIVDVCKHITFENLPPDLSNVHIPPETIQRIRQSNEKSPYKRILTVVPKLREHPQLEDIVPMMSVGMLRWFPSEDCEVVLAHEETQGEYRLWVGKGLSGQDKVFEERIVSLEEAADAVYAYITKYRQD